MEKTIKEWLETLPEPYRSEALGNMREFVKKIKCPSLHRSIALAFDWTCAPQESEYWKSVYYRAEAGEFNTSSLDKDSEK